MIFLAVWALAVRQSLGPLASCAVLLSLSLSVNLPAYLFARLMVCVVCVCVCVRASMRACVRACGWVHACVRAGGRAARARACVGACMGCVCVPEALLPKGNCWGPMTIGKAARVDPEANAKLSRNARGDIIDIRSQAAWSTPCCSAY